MRPPVPSALDTFASSLTILLKVLALLILSLDNDSTLIFEQAPIDEESLFTSSMASSWFISPVTIIRDEEEDDDDEDDGNPIVESEVCKVFSLSLSDIEMPSSMLFPMHMGSLLLLLAREELDMEDIFVADEIAVMIDVAILLLGKGVGTGEEQPECMLLLFWLLLILLLVHNFEMNNFGVARPS